MVATSHSHRSQDRKPTARIYTVGSVVIAAFDRAVSPRMPSPARITDTGRAALFDTEAAPPAFPREEFL